MQNLDGYINKGTEIGFFLRNLSKHRSSFLQQELVLEVNSLSSFCKFVTH